MMLRLPALAVCGLCLFNATARAQDLPAPMDGHVLDLAQVLDATAEGRIERILAETEETTGVAMEVVTMTGIAVNGGGAGERLDAYAGRLLDAWQVGSPDRKDGILVLVTTEPADARIALGSGYAPVYDERAARVLAASVLPAFRAGDIPAGIEAGVIAARERLVVPFLAGAPVTASEGFETAAPRLPSSLLYILLAGAVLGFLAYRKLRGARLLKTCPSCGDLTLTRTFEVIEPPADKNEGSGIEHRLCKSCGYTDRQVYSLKAGMMGGIRRKPTR
jgi:uncharacterized protein